MKRRVWLAAFFVVLCLSQIQCLLIPSDQESGSRSPNQGPHVRITGGVFNSDPAGVDYRVDFRWHGWDNDGVVTAFEWAIDDTTLERAWHTTTDFGTLFSFQATVHDDADSSFFDWHRFFIRSIDNEFSRSDIDSRYFNARTIAPKTRITFPIISQGRLLLRRPQTFNVIWEGEDLDSSRPERIPVAYEYKLVRFDLTEHVDQMISQLITHENTFLDTLQHGDKTAWIRISSDITSLRLSELPLAELFIFGIRAIDEAGAIEPALELGQNFIPFEVSDQECQPIVTMRENRLGRHEFPTDGELWRIEVPSNTELRFTWEGDAAFCGSRPGNVNYGLDLEDPGDENDNAPNGIGGWIGWGLWEEVQTPFSFPDRDDGKVHNFYMKMMDESNNPRSERFCWVAITVVAFPMNKTVLIIDDATPAPFMYAPDPIHDAFRDRVLQCINEFTEPGEEVGRFDIFRNPETGFNPEAIPLRVVASYKMIIWNNFKHNTLSSGLKKNEFERNLLTSYIGAGGRFYLYGASPVGCLAGDNFNYGGDGLCPDVPGADEPAWDDESFIWTFMHLTNCITSPSSPTQQVDGWVGSESVHPLYPDLDLNTEVWDPWLPRIGDGLPKGGTIWYETYKNSRVIPIQEEPGMDTLYVVKTFNYEGVQSRLEGYPCALRYQSTAEDSALGVHHGRVFLQMFPFFTCYEGPATETACKAITWLMTGRDE